MEEPLGHPLGGSLLRVLGVDPGTVICGYGVVEMDGAGRPEAIGYGIIRASVGGEAGRALAARLHRVFAGLCQVIEAYRPEALAIEEAFVWKNARTALQIGHGRAAAMVAAAEHGLPVFEYQPSVVKKAVTANGRAQKMQVQVMVKGLLRLAAVPEPADAADALAVAFTHLHRARLAVLTAAGRAR